tara:strand:- start:28 stop:591 length:564 start_codon:yes stop_codon:yes gene_type:complete
MTTFTDYHGFIKDEELKIVREKFENYFKLSEFKRTNSIVEMFASSVAEYEFLQKINKKVLKKCSEFCKESIQLDKLWMVHSTPKICDENELPYLPHFDKTRYVKGFLYLYDVDENRGPLTVCGKHVPNVDRRRRNMPSNYLRFKSNVETSDEYKSKMKKICGKAGTLIVFDTNTLHQAGIVRPKKDI